jgi:hypothetical protein
VRRKSAGSQVPTRLISCSPSLGAEEIRDDRLRLRRSCDLKTNRLLPGLDNDPERQERAALAH